MTEQALLKRLLFSIALFFAVYVIGGLGFWVVELIYMPAGFEGPQGGLISFYMAAITVTTVGYGLDYTFEDWGGSAFVVGYLWVIFYLLFSYLSVLYASANIISALVEGAVGKLWMKHVMEKLLKNLKEHYIVCGAGATGRHIIDELLKTGNTVVVIDSNKEIENEYGSNTHAIPIVGDATDDNVLEHAGIKQASGIFAALSDDKDNLFIALTARQVNPGIRIVGRAVDPHTVPKLKAVGANAVVSPNHIGGLRMASEMIRPGVVSFLDSMLRKSDANIRFSEVKIDPDMQAAGHTLGDLDIANAVGLTVIGVFKADGAIIYNPKPDAQVQPGDSLIVISDSDALRKLKNHTKFGIKKSGFGQRTKE